MPYVPTILMRTAAGDIPGPLTVRTNDPVGIRAAPSGTIVVAECQTSAADGSGNLVGGGISNSGPIVSTPAPYSRLSRVACGYRPLRQTNGSGLLVASNPVEFTAAELYLSSDGTNYVRADCKVFPLNEDSTQTFILGDYEHRTLDTSRWFDASGTVINNPDSQPMAFRAPWNWFYLRFAPPTQGDAVLVAAAMD